MDENCKRILPNSGWYFPGKLFSSFDPHNSSLLDKNIVAHCRKFGGLGFTYIIYPIGGLHRYLWKPTSNDINVPPIHLPDLQMKTEYWSNYVCGCISPWIDPDSADDKIAQLSSDHFYQEIDYAKYLGLRTLLIKLKHASSPGLAELLRIYCTSAASIDFWILLPNELDNTDLNLWTIWRNFRTLCENSEKLFVALTLSHDLDDQFSNENDKHSTIWHAEPLVAIHLDYSLFLSDSNKTAPTIPKIHTQLLNSLIVSPKQHIILSSMDTELSSSQIRQLVGSIQQILQSNPNFNKTENSLASYLDLLQTPLQPLSDNLDSTIYQTFEQDQTKYEYYQRAIKEALRDIKIQIDDDTIIVFVLGAGRGPLVEASLNAKKELENEGITLSMNLVAIEKNRNAILSLKYCNQEKWNNSVQIIHSDMRSLAEFVEKGTLKRPDLIVSELLGSFGDNELSPECLDGVDSVLKPNTISVPQSYTNFLTPIQSIKLHQNIKEVERKRTKKQQTCATTGKLKGGEEQALDRFYIVCMDHFCYLSDSVEPCFEFVHPNKERTPNTRKARLQFMLQRNCELMGFAGYFEAILYKDIVLSTHPLRCTDKLYSWFPALFPLRSLHYFPNKTQIAFTIERKVDEGGCWYEYRIEYEGEDGTLWKSELQNEAGQSQYMKLY